MPGRWPAAGFTLVELLVVLAILTLLAGLVGPKVIDQFGKSKTKTAGIQIADLEKTLELYKLDTGRFPTKEEGLEALVKKPATATAWSGPYLKGNPPAVPVDPPREGAGRCPAAGPFRVRVQVISQMRLKNG